MPVDLADTGDPRSRLVRQKYFCLRPQPLERWLWSKRIPSSAERVFWVHWQEGMQRGDWCSEIPLRRVARECHLDASTVTRAYQLLIRLGCLRRTDPGRDPANPFQQATAVTEIRLPRELLVELDRYPNRRSGAEAPGAAREQGREHRAPSHGIAAVDGTVKPPLHGSKPSPALSVGGQLVATTDVESQPHDGSTECPSSDLDVHDGATPPSSSDPFPGLTGRDRLRAITQLLDVLSPRERRAYQDALRMHRASMDFDAQSGLSGDAKNKILQLLGSLANSGAQCRPSTPGAAAPCSGPPPRKSHAPRKLSFFELGRLRRHLQTAAGVGTPPDLLRQVVWSVEAGALRRFDTQHAVHIALKKIREGVWTRPHRMPPNWARALSEPSAPETCGVA